MTEVLHSPSSSSSPSISTPTHGAALFHQTQSYVGDEVISGLTVGDDAEEESRAREKREKDRRDQLSLLALLVTLFRKSFCKTDRHNFSSRGGCRSGVMEIGWPTNVQHVNHVTFDRFDGFLGLPVEFEPEVPRRAPSASLEQLDIPLATWINNNYVSTFGMGCALSRFTISCQSLCKHKLIQLFGLCRGLSSNYHIAVSLYIYELM